MTSFKSRVKIVSGKYDLHEGLHILLSLIEQKINFHELQILSTQERGEVTDSDYKIGYFTEQADYIREQLEKSPDEYEIELDGQIFYTIRKKNT